MNAFDLHKRDAALPHSANACPELEAFVILDVVKRYPGIKKGFAAAAALGVFGRDLEQERRMLAYIDSLVITKLLYRHNFGYHLTPSGVDELARLKENLRGPITRAQA